eukprot:Pgem_evm1s5853
MSNSPTANLKFPYLYQEYFIDQFKAESFDKHSLKLTSMIKEIVGCLNIADKYEEIDISKGTDAILSRNCHDVTGYVKYNAMTEQIQYWPVKDDYFKMSEETKKKQLFVPLCLDAGEHYYSKNRIFHKAVATIKWKSCYDNEIVNQQWHYDGNKILFKKVGVKNLCLSALNKGKKVDLNDCNDGDGHKEWNRNDQIRTSLDMISYTDLTLRWSPNNGFLATKDTTQYCLILDLQENDNLIPVMVPCITALKNGYARPVYFKSTPNKFYGDADIDTTGNIGEIRVLDGVKGKRVDLCLTYGNSVGRNSLFFSECKNELDKGTQTFKQKNSNFISPLNDFRKGAQDQRAFDINLNNFSTRKKYKVQLWPIRPWAESMGQMYHQHFSRLIRI